MPPAPVLVAVALVAISIYVGGEIVTGVKHVGKGIVKVFKKIPHPDVKYTYKPEEK